MTTPYQSIVNGSFSQGTAGTGNATLVGWEGQHIEMHPAATLGAPNSYGNVVEMDASRGTISVIQQKVTILSAQQATLNFDLWLRSGGTANVDGVRVEIVGPATTNPASPGQIVQQHSFLPTNASPATSSMTITFPTSGEYTIRFVEIGDDSSIGALLDNVSMFIVPCFAAGTVIATATGEVAVEDVRVGDMVMTADNGYQPVRWTGSRRLDAADLAAAPELLPVRIRAGALGEGQPVADLLVSPQHRILVSSRIARRMFGEDEVLMAAKHLVGLPGIERALEVRQVTYVHIMFDRHEIVFSNGTRSESLFAGREALKALGPEAEREIFQILPELRSLSLTGRLPAARQLIPGRPGRRMVARHLANAIPLIDPSSLRRDLPEIAFGI